MLDGWRDLRVLSSAMYRACSSAVDPQPSMRDVSWERRKQEKAVGKLAARSGACGRKFAIARSRLLRTGGRWQPPASVRSPVLHMAESPRQVRVKVCGVTPGRPSCRPNRTLTVYDPSPHHTRRPFCGLVAHCPANPRADRLRIGLPVGGSTVCPAAALKDTVAYDPATR